MGYRKKGETMVYPGPGPPMEVISYALLDCIDEDDYRVDLPRDRIC